jgi:hypothetical protein
MLLTAAVHLNPLVLQAMQAPLPGACDFPRPSWRDVPHRATRVTRLTVALRNPIARNSLTTASTLHSASESNSPLSGFQCHSSEFADVRRTMRTPDGRPPVARDQGRANQAGATRYRDDRLGHSLEAS